MGRWSCSALGGDLGAAQPSGPNPAVAALAGDVKEFDRVSHLLKAAWNWTQNHRVIFKNKNGIAIMKRNSRFQEDFSFQTLSD